MVVAGAPGFIQNFSGGEIIVILIVALVVLGPDRLPEMARSAGKMLHKLRGMTEGLQSEVRDVMDDPAMQPIKELGELAARPRQKLTEYALEAEAEERARKEAERAAAAAAAAAEIAAAEPDMGPDTPDGDAEAPPAPGEAAPAPGEAGAGSDQGGEVVGETHTGGVTGRDADGEPTEPDRGDG